MGTKLFITTDSESEAAAWAVVFRALGLELVGRPSNRITHDGSWAVRARSADMIPGHGKAPLGRGRPSGA